MADIAAAAGVSRPALYQYFENRTDIFRAAFEVWLWESVEAALAALAADGSLAARLDGYLQRANADAYEALASTPFGAELMEARHQFAEDIAMATSDHARKGLRKFVRSATSVESADRSLALDLLILSPAGLKTDRPSPRVYRRRLSALAEAAARMLEG